MNLWKDYTFGGESGARRFLSFLVDLDAQGGEINPEIREQIIDKGWSKVFGSTKNFANPKAIHIETKEPAYKFLTVKGTNKIFDFNSLERTGLRGSSTLSTLAKEAAFLVCVRVAEKTGKTNPLDIFGEVNDLPREEIYEYLKAFPEIKDVEKTTGKLFEKHGLVEAAAVATSFVKSGMKSTGYELHRESPLVKKLRDHGSKLSGLSKDKWNPADVYFIKIREVSNIQSLLKIDSLVEFNQAFNELVELKTMIPISLKQSESASLGSISTKRFGKMDKPERWNPQRTPNLVRSIQRLERTIKVPVSVTLSKSPKAIAVNKSIKTVTELFTNPDFVKLVSTNKSWMWCYPPVIHWLEDLRNPKETLETAILEALSASPASSWFYLCTPKKWELKGEEEVKVSLMAIEIQPNTTSVLLHYEISEGGKNRQGTCQVRTKDSIPQIITYSQILGNSNWELKIV